jgi:hypothetical protein
MTRAFPLIGFKTSSLAECAATALLLALCMPAALAQTAPAPQSAQPEAALNADEILQQMSRITGLPVKAPLKKERVSKAEVEKYLKENLAAEYTPAEIHGQEAALKVFGLVDADFDLQKFLVSLYTEQAAGFYDPRRKTMFIADWVEPDQQKMVLAHELTHALQDQSFDLWKFMHATPDDDDASAARQALVEGYATLAMIQAMLGSVPIEKLPSLDAMMDQVVNQQMSEYPIFSKAPFFLRFQVLFPYAQGMHFVHEGLMNGGWKRLNEAFLNPPATTRDIFQPDLYFKPATPGQPEATVDLPAPPAIAHDSQLKQVESNFMGEIGYYALLGQLLSQDEAAKVTKPWVADRYEVYEGPQQGQFLLLARTRWENAGAASAFCSDYQSILGKRWPESAAQVTAGTNAIAADGAEQDAKGPIFAATSGTRRTFLLRQGDECRWVENVPAAQADAVEKWLEALP